MLKAIVAAPDESVFTLPLAGQRSSVVRYWTVDHTSTLAAGWPSRRRRTTTLSVVPRAGVGFETLTVEPWNLAAKPGGGVAVATGVAGSAVAVASTARLDELFDSGSTLWTMFNAVRLIDTRGMISAPARTASPTTISTTSTSPRPAYGGWTAWRGRRRRLTGMTTLALALGGAGAGGL